MLGFDLPAGGTYRLSAGFFTSINYCIAQISINGKPAGGPIDFYSDSVKQMGPVPLGDFDMPAGRNTISFTITGKNPESDGLNVGFDWLEVVPLREAGENP